jgi:hypothetical protein
LEKPNAVDENLAKIPAAWKAAILILVRPLMERQGCRASLVTACRDLGVAPSTAHAAVREVVRRLGSPRTAVLERRIREIEGEARAVKREVAEQRFRAEVAEYAARTPGARTWGERQHFSDAFKDHALERARAAQLTLARASTLLGIPIDSLKKFSRARERSPSEAMPRDLPENVRLAINAFLRDRPPLDTEATGRPGGSSVRAFCRRHPDLLKSLGMTDRKMAAWLRELGLVSPKGIFLKNTGVDSIIRFRPNAVWGTDGKQMTIIVNGEIFRWVWQCLVDCKTTVIVGGLVAPEETTQTLLEAIGRSKDQTGITPFAIVLDNRLSENMPAIRAYLDEFGIEVIRTFPGNSKSNGIVEGNFSVFERWCGGRIEVTGETPERLSRSIAEAVVGIFTQMRNHVPRRSLSWKSPKEVVDQSSPPAPEEEQAMRQRLRAMAERLKNEEAIPEVSAEKQAALGQVEQEVHPPDAQSFRRALRPAIFTTNLLLQALAIWKTRRETNPEKHYGHAYFGGIARNLANEAALACLTTHLDATYAHHWDTMGRLRSDAQAKSLAEAPEKTCLRLASDYLRMPVPAYANRVLLDLKDSFLVASGGLVERATRLRQMLERHVLSWTRQNHRHRQRLIRALFEWENFLRIHAGAEPVHA